MPKIEIPRSGIVTVKEWMKAPDGVLYLYLWCKDWRITTDKQFPIYEFHSTEKWELIAMKDGEVAAVFPRCQIRGFMVCDEPPKFADVYCF